MPTEKSLQVALASRREVREHVVGKAVKAERARRKAGAP